MAEYEGSSPLRILDDGFIGIDQKAMFADIEPFLRFWLIMGIPIFAMYFMLDDFLSTQFPDINIDRIITTLAYVVLGYICLRTAYLVVAVRYRSYKLDHSLLHAKYGVFTKVHIMVPRDRVQYTGLSRSFMQRACDLASLTVHTAGTKSGSVGIRNMRNSEAERIQDELVAQMKDE